MARAATPTLLNLDRYAAIIGLSPVHFNNLNDGETLDSAIPFWNQEKHDQLAEAIAGAEAMLAEVMGYDVAPVYHQDTLIFKPTGKVRTRQRAGLSGASSSEWDTWGDLLVTEAWARATLRVPRGQIQVFGSRENTLAKADATVTIVDDTTTITVDPIGVTDPDAVRVYYRVADGAVAAVDDRWRIWGLTVSIAGTVATITGPKYLFAKPSVLAAATAADYDAAGSYIGAVDVYTVATDPELPVTIQWNAYRASYGDPAEDTEQTGAAWLKDAAEGTFNVFPATYADGAHVKATATTAAIPARFVVDYLAGWPRLDNGHVHSLFEQAVVRLAHTLLPRPFHWILDMSMTWRSDRDPVEDPDQVSPFGTTKGAYAAWTVAELMKLKGTGI